MVALATMSDVEEHWLAGREGNVEMSIYRKDSLLEVKARHGSVLVLVCN